MTEHPILFSGPMIRAILEGRKTQTRRIYKPLRPAPYEHVEDGKVWEMDECGDYVERTSPYGTIGDALWVRETFYECVNNNDRIHYAANRQPIQNTETRTYRKRPSIFMPRSASRITLEITDIRVQRLQEITEEDARAEGVEFLFTEAELKGRPELQSSAKHFNNYLWHGHFGQNGMGSKISDGWPHQYSSYETAAGSYSSLWELINGYGSWASNPWVWAISFKRTK